MLPLLPSSIPLHLPKAKVNDRRKQSLEEGFQTTPWAASGRFYLVSGTLQITPIFFIRKAKQIWDLGLSYRLYVYIIDS